ncbi:hypothetical protein [Salmonella phage PHA46]
MSMIKKVLDVLIQYCHNVSHRAAGWINIPK